MDSIVATNLPVFPDILFDALNFSAQSSLSSRCKSPCYASQNLLDRTWTAASLLYNLSRRFNRSYSVLVALPYQEKGKSARIAVCGYFSVSRNSSSTKHGHCSHLLRQQRQQGHPKCLTRRLIPIRNSRSVSITVSTTATYSGFTTQLSLTWSGAFTRPQYSILHHQWEYLLQGASIFSQGRRQSLLCYNLEFSKGHQKPRAGPVRFIAAPHLVGCESRLGSPTRPTTNNASTTLPAPKAVRYNYLVVLCSGRRRKATPPT